MREEFGKVRHGDGWVLESELPFIRMQWVKEGDTWFNPRVAEENKRVAQLKEAGYTLRKEDMSWVSPDDSEKVEQALWKCEDNWLTKEEADKFHAEIGRWWQVGSKYFEIYSTCNQEYGIYAGQYADLLYPELTKIFGRAPKTPPVFVLLRNLNQYNSFAAGSQDPEAPRQPAGSEGFSTLHHSFFADVFFDGQAAPPIYKGAGVGYWDTETQNGAWGPHSLRHAAAQSYADEIDRSWNTISEMFDQSGGGGGQGALEQFWTEKDIPRWFRYGAASYVERFADDGVLGVADGTGMRNWSIGEVRKSGLRPLQEIIDFALSLDDIESSSRMIHEAGAVMTYIMKAGDNDIVQAHKAFKSALKKEEGIKEAREAFHKALLAKETQIRKYLGV